jgi:hypothetical protein
MVIHLSLGVLRDFTSNEVCRLQVAHNNFSRTVGERNNDKSLSCTNITLLVYTYVYVLLPKKKSSKMSSAAAADAQFHTNQDNVVALPRSTQENNNNKRKSLN